MVRRSRLPQRLPPYRLKTARLGEKIHVSTPSLPELLAKVDNQCAKLVLYLDDLPLLGMEPVSCDPAANVITLILYRADQSQKNWHELLGRPNALSRVVTVGLGTDDRQYKELDLTFELELMHQYELWFFVLLFLFYTGFIAYLATRSSLMRVGPPLADGSLQSFDLGKFQMTLWFYLITVSYVFIWQVIGELDTLNNSALLLMGLSSGTALGSIMIDARKQPGTPAQANTAQSTQGSVSGNRPTSGSFLQDVLHDGNGLSLPRLQMFVWTLILALVFIVDVYARLNMPNFSATLLSFLGLSSTTFLAFQGSEPTVQSDQSPPDPGSSQRRTLPATSPPATSPPANNPV